MFRSALTAAVRVLPRPRRGQGRVSFCTVRWGAPAACDGWRPVRGRGRLTPETRTSPPVMCFDTPRSSHSSHRRAGTAPCPWDRSHRSHPAPRRRHSRRRGSRHLHPHTDRRPNSPRWWHSGWACFAGGASSRPPPSVIAVLAIPRLPKATEQRQAAPAREPLRETGGELVERRRVHTDLLDETPCRASQHRARSG